MRADKMEVLDLADDAAGDWLAPEAAPEEVQRGCQSRTSDSTYFWGTQSPVAPGCAPGQTTTKSSTVRAAARRGPVTWQPTYGAWPVVYLEIGKGVCHNLRRGANTPGAPVPMIDMRAACDTIV